ncbi:hypothetical protein B0H21DRAFT_747472 [Amylocystis lapponica]|nr:hypothetical protein B0H21DRAFT_747472 [Amylocystis lapponica]
MLLSQHRVSKSEVLYYVPNFVTVEEESLLIRKIIASPQPRWKQLANRRLQIWGGNMTAKGFLIPEEMPPFVRT